MDLQRQDRGQWRSDDENHFVEDALPCVRHVSRMSGAARGPTEPESVNPCWAWSSRPRRPMGSQRSGGSPASSPTSSATMQIVETHRPRKDSVLAMTVHEAADDGAP